MGSDITLRQEHHLYSFSRKRYPQSSVHLSNDGLVLAIASRFKEEVASGTLPSEVFPPGIASTVPGIHILHNFNGTWETADIIKANSTEGQFGWGLALSHDGSKIAVASNETVRLFEWNGTKHEPFPESFPAGEESVVSLSSGGSIVAVGLPFSGDNAGGRTVTYDSLSPVCPENTSRLRLSLTTGTNADQTRWALSDKSGLILQEGGPYETDGREATFAEEFCVEEREIEDGCVVFTIVRDDRDMSGYSLFLEGEEIKKSGNPGFESNVGFEQLRLGGNCACGEGQAHFRLILETDQEPEETSWRLTSGSLSGPVLLQGGSYDRSHATTLIVRDICVDVDECAVFAVRDTGRNGFGSNGFLFGRGGLTLYWDGNEAASTRGDFGIESVNRVGPSCAPTVVSPIATSGPSLAPATAMGCPGGSDLFRFNYTTGNLTEGTSWDLVDTSNGVILEGGPYNAPGNRLTSFVDETCVSTCTTLTIRFCCGSEDEDESSAGTYMATVGGVVIASGVARAGRDETVVFGNCLGTFDLP